MTRRSTRGRRALERPRLSMVDEAATVIRNRILELSLPPGRPISSVWLVKHLMLGRTPIREAINRLAAEGLVQPPISCTSTRWRRGCSQARLLISSLESKFFLKSRKLNVHTP